MLPPGVGTKGNKLSTRGVSWMPQVCRPERQWPRAGQWEGKRSQDETRRGEAGVPAEVRGPGSTDLVMLRNLGFSCDYMVTLCFHERGSLIHMLQPQAPSQLCSPWTSGACQASAGSRDLAHDVDLTA